MSGSQKGVRLHLVRGGAAFASDDDLVRGLWSDAAGAGREAWDRLSPLVRGFFRRALGPEEEIDDAVQNVFLRFFHKVSQLRDPSALRSFIIAIAVNELRVELRKRKMRRFVRLTDDGAIPERGVAGNAVVYTALHRFYRIMDRVSTDERAAYTLRHVEGLELAEVATALDLSLATVKRRLARANTRIMRLVRKDLVLMEYLMTQDLIAEGMVGTSGEDPRDG